MAESKEQTEEEKKHAEWEKQQADAGISVHAPRAGETVPDEGKAKPKK